MNFFRFVSQNQPTDNKSKHFVNLSFNSMDSISEKLLYDNVADNVRNNIEDINKLLGNSSIQSKVAAQEKQIIDFLTLDIETLIEDEPKADYYDLNKVSKIFELLQPTKPEGKKKLKSLRSESTSSLVSTPSSNQSSEDVSQPEEYTNEVRAHLTAVRSVLETVRNTSIECPDLNAIKDKETAKIVKFCDLVMSLQKVAKELNNIASSDKLVDNQGALTIDSNLLTDLDHLSQVSLLT